MDPSHYLTFTIKMFYVIIMVAFFCMKKFWTAILQRKTDTLARENANSLFQRLSHTKGINL